MSLQTTSFQRMMLSSLALMERSAREELPPIAQLAANAITWITGTQGRLPSMDLLPVSLARIAPQAPRLSRTALPVDTQRPLPIPSSALV